MHGRAGGVPDGDAVAFEVGVRSGRAGRAAGRTSPPSQAMAIARCRQVSRSASLTRLQDRVGSHIEQSPSEGGRRGTADRDSVRGGPDQASCARGGTANTGLEAGAEPYQARQRESSADGPRLLPCSDRGSCRHGSQRSIVVGPRPHQLVCRGGRRDREDLGARTPGASRRATIGGRLIADRRTLDTEGPCRHPGLDVFNAMARRASSGSGVRSSARRAGCRVVVGWGPVVRGLRSR
jgi:hypothetical protein